MSQAAAAAAASHPSRPAASAAPKAYVSLSSHAHSYALARHSSSDNGESSSGSWTHQAKSLRGSITTAYQRVGTSPRPLTGPKRVSSLIQKMQQRQGWARYVLHLFSLDGLLGMVLLYLTFKFVLFPAAEMDVGGMTAKRNTDAFFLDLWTRHVTTHPVRARDRTGFAEMGLRTQMYAHLLADPSLPDFDEYEKVLWPFIPGIKSLRQSYFEGAKFSAARPKKRGIVMSLGGNNFDFAVQFLSIIRNHWRSEIPVELYYWGDNDLSAPLRHYLTTTFTHVSTIDLERLGFFDESLTQLNRQGYALKPFALIATNLTEVILADADAVLLAHPDDFFRQPGFAETGTLFFHDRDHVRAGAAEIIHEFMGAQLELRGPSERLQQSKFWQRKGIYEQESGVVVVDKSKMEVFSALLFAAWQNTGEVRQKTTYRVFWGDKETFWLAFELASFPYNFVKHYAGAIGSQQSSSEEEFCSEHPFHVFDAPEDHSLHVRDVPLEELASSSVDTTTQPGGVKDLALRSAPPKKRRSKPAWFNGSLAANKMQSQEAYIKPTAWAMQGHWEFTEETETWCMRNFTAMPMSDFGLGKTVEALVDTAVKGLEEARKVIPPAPKKVKKPLGKAQAAKAEVALAKEAAKVE